MKKCFLYCAALAVASVCQATTLTVGSPNYNNMAGNPLSPRFGIYVNFDALTPFAPVASNAYAAMGVQSITSNTTNNPLYAYPYSSQSSPNYLSTASSVTGGITITLNNLVDIIGIGILESDGASDTLLALGATGNTLGSFTVTVPSSGKTPFNAYYVLRDPTQDIRSLVISSSSGNFGVDDLQFAPEPLNLTLVGSGLFLLGMLRARKGKRNVKSL